MPLYCGVVNAQELVSRGHHINAVGLALGVFFSMNWYTGLSAGDRWRITLITKNSVLRRAEDLALEMLQLRTSIWPDWYGGASMPEKVTSAFLEWKRRTSPISTMTWGPRAGPTPNIPITTGYSGSAAVRDCISLLNAASVAEAPRS